MKIGDKAEVVSIPADLPPNFLDTRSFSNPALDGSFPSSIFHGEMIALEVGEVVGQRACMRSIWIEPNHLTFIVFWPLATDN
jgi:hypothetical protein